VSSGRVFVRGVGAKRDSDCGALKGPLLSAATHHYLADWAPWLRHSWPQLKPQETR